MSILLWPFSVIYRLIIVIRNLLFDVHILKAENFDVPVISVGNLRVGGTGKSPHVLYLAQLLSAESQVAILSRGYGRKSSGFRIINKEDSVMTAGDEPLQYFRLLKNTIVAVDEKRANGIHELLKRSNAPKVIILDDAFQHRSVKPGLSILLTEFDRLYVNDHLLPLGRLREPISGAKRADIIVVTKCPGDITEDQQNEVAQLLQPMPQQKLFFSYMRYSDEIEFENGAKEAIDFLRNKAVLLLSGIDNPAPLATFLKTQCTSFDQQLFADHHPFTAGDLTNVRKKFDKFVGSGRGIIITTRKDLMRLQSSELKVVLKGIPLAVVDITVAMTGTNNNTFKQEIIQYVKSN